MPVKTNHYNDYAYIHIYNTDAIHGGWGVGRSEFTLRSIKDTCYIICNEKSVTFSESLYEFVIVTSS